MSFDGKTTETNGAEAPAHGLTTYANGPAPEVPPTPVKTRRVGTLTMAISLVALGVVLLLRVFLPGLDYILIARLSPVVLVLLGVEILVANLRHHDEKIKYDFVSTFICLLLLAGTLLAATIPELVMLERGQYDVARRMENQLSAESYALIEDKDLPVYTIEWYVSINSTNYSADMEIDDLSLQDYVQFRVRFDGDFENRQDFAAAVALVRDTMSTLVPKLDYYSAYSYSWELSSSDLGGTNIQHALWADSPRLLSGTATQLADYVETMIWVPEVNSFMDENEYENFLVHPEQYLSGYYVEDEDIDGFYYYEDGYYHFDNGLTIHEDDLHHLQDGGRVVVDEDTSDVTPADEDEAA